MQPPRSVSRLIAIRPGRRAVALVALALAVAIAATSAGALPARAQNALDLRIDAVDASAFPMVAVDLTVRDERSLPLAALAPEQIELIEDRAVSALPVASIETIQRPETPVTVLLAIDVSGSMAGQPLADAKAAARQLLEGLDAADLAAVMAFSGEVARGTPLTLDPARERGFTDRFDELIAFVDGLEAEGNTPLYDATWKAVELTAQQPAGNRAVILLTDGRDEVLGGAAGSGSDLADDDMPIRAAGQKGVPVFTIGLGQAVDAAWLERLATESGGSFDSTPDSAELPALFRAVQDRLEQQFRVTYESTIEDPEAEHRLQVVVRAGSARAEDEAVFVPAGDLVLTGDEVPPYAPVVDDPAAEEPAALDPDLLTPPVTEPGSGDLPLSPLALASIVTALALVGAVAVARRRAQARQPVLRCRKCGTPKAVAGAPCPCGSTKEYMG